ncbi:hypothetical protein ILYODFUR_038187 [Ilyodon furcidens]|uniref:Uncharacterized protein n=1 Tax=Ilyodon furcidens TaxID=33524 RepID=A0ABV0TII6_9TELE
MQELLHWIIINDPVDDFFLMFHSAPAFLDCYSLLTFVVAVHSSRFVIAASALTKLLPLSVHLGRTPLSSNCACRRLSWKLFCKQMLYVCGLDGPNEGETTSYLAFNQND